MILDKKKKKKHNAFLLYWYCEYFICSYPKAIISEYASHITLLQ